jgi:hypothetical protein
MYLKLESMSLIGSHASHDHVTTFGRPERATLFAMQSATWLGAVA